MVGSEAEASAAVIAVDHPVVRHKVALLRDRSTDVPTFRKLVAELALLVIYEATRNVETERIDVETPLEVTPGERVRHEHLALVPVLRAGLGMLDGGLELYPAAAVGFVGVFREEEALRPVPYFIKLPGDIDQRHVLLLDPMVATGGSASYAVRACKKAGAVGVTLVALIVAPEGAERLARDHPDVPLYTAALDRELNQSGFILPGLGDAGDRLFATQ